jgi:hypothetical protein
MKGKLYFQIDHFRLLFEIGSSKFAYPTEDFPWRTITLFTPILRTDRNKTNIFEETYSTYGLSLPTIINFSKESGIFWEFTIKILGFGIRFHSLMGF